MNTVLAGIAVVTFIALALVVYGQEWAGGLAGLGIVVLIAAAVLYGKRS